MKKFLGIIILSLMLSGCYTTGPYQIEESNTFKEHQYDNHAGWHGDHRHRTHQRIC